MSAILSHEIQILSFTNQDFKLRTVDGSEIPRPTTWDGAKTPVNNGINYQLQLVNAGFLPSTVSYPVSFEPHSRLTWAPSLQTGHHWKRKFPGSIVVSGSPNRG